MHSPFYRKALVIGATCQVGHFLLQYLSDLNIEIIALSRDFHKSDSENIKWIKCDLTTDSFAFETDISVVFHLAPITLLPKIIPFFPSMGIKQVVALSSTSRYLKMTATSSKDKGLAMTLTQAESEVEKLCSFHNITWTILRPTLIYSKGFDKNISFIRQFIRRFKFFPITRKANGLRQPVLAEDIAEACVKVLDCSAAFNRSYNLSGGEALTYRDMVIKIFLAEKIKPRFIYLPLVIYRLMLTLIGFLPKYRYITPDMANRMNAHHYFDSSDAKNDFGYFPKGFML